VRISRRTQRSRAQQRRATLRTRLLAGVVFAVIAALIGFPDGGASADADTVTTDTVTTDTVDVRQVPHRVSVVIPTHNRATELETALVSVLDSPLITSPDQIIVVDDDSQDRTPDVVQQFGVRYVTVARHSPASSRNAGWRRMTSEYVTFLDDDDVWLPGNLEPQLAALDARPDAGFAYGIARCAHEDLEPSDATFPAPPLASGHTPGQLHENYPQLGVVLFRRAALEEVAGFDPRVQYGEDAELMLRIASRHEIVGVERVGMLHRLRQASRARSDYFWPVRDIARWRPKGLGVGWHPALRFKLSTRGLFFRRFVDDAAACHAAGHHWDAFVCAARATWVSPLHAVRQHRYLRSACMPNASWQNFRARLSGTRFIRTGTDPTV
jgi:glycosyltransferase involved in cell wall biosynthesis